ncbi:hypothetical protein H0E87_011139 [Populus deltoides]|uniref:F-box domain-containing protein n=1 Tax=Populus deltoides TaxID=3696 RepID=A0A8T2YVZ7_POPDE|nr:hypothetical protein H0E87_011139 [Populus deltoides]
MDTLLHTPTSLAKRPCPFPSSPSSPPPNPNKLPHMNNQVGNLLQTFLNLADSHSLSIDQSFEHLLDSSPCDADQSLLIDRALKLGSLLLEAGNRSARKRSSVHNSLTWALPPDLTIKLFSMLDAQSLCYAAATCSMFYKCAMDPLCYANIDLTTVVPKVNNAVVSTMIQRAGKALRSLKLGIVPGPTLPHGSCQPLVYGIRNAVEVSNFSWNDKKTRQGKESSTLTRYCLTPLSGDNGAAGAVLRGLHLYNIERIDNTSLCGALSACPSLLDLEIIGLHVDLRQTLVSVSMNCPLIERLFFESSKTGRDDSLKSSTCVDLVNNCPNLTSLALRGFKLYDYKLRILVKGFCKLKYVDFSTSYSITGSFLRNLGGDMGGSLLEVLIFRDCMHLKEAGHNSFPFSTFFTLNLFECERSWLSWFGGWKLPDYLHQFLLGTLDFFDILWDISNREGLAAAGDSYGRCYSLSIIPTKQVLEERPDICLLAEFPSEGSFVDLGQMTDSDLTSEVSLSSQLSSRTSDGLSFMCTSEINYSSDQTSGNEEG